MSAQQEKQNMQNRVLPILLLIAGVSGAVCSAIHQYGLAFACCSLVVAIGVQELRATNLFNEG